MMDNAQRFKVKQNVQFCSFSVYQNINYNERIEAIFQKKIELFLETGWSFSVQQLSDI